MGTWRLLLNGVQIGDSSSSGVLEAPKNKGTTPVVYTVEYTDDDGYVSTGSYTVQSSPDCIVTCEITIISGSETLPSGGGTIEFKAISS
jgi:hypothetical protein